LLLQLSNDWLKFFWSDCLSFYLDFDFVFEFGRFVSFFRLYDRLIFIIEFDRDLKPACNEFFLALLLALDPKAVLPLRSLFVIEL